MKTYSFKNGIKDGLPIFFAYLAVSFTFGLASSNIGISPLVSTIISGTNLTSAGQFAGIKMIAIGCGFFEVFFAVLIINSRYILMSLSLSQNLPENTGTIKRLVMSCFVTDEIFAMANYRKKGLNFNYFIGLAFLPYIGWTVGTLVGCLVNSILPPALQSAMGIALYCMFIAIVLPPAKKSKPILFCLAISIAMSCLMFFTPVLRDITFGISIIICSVVGASITALIFPVKESQDE